MNIFYEAGTPFSVTARNCNAGNFVYPNGWRSMKKNHPFPVEVLPLPMIRRRSHFEKEKWIALIALIALFSACVVAVTALASLASALQLH